MDQADAGVIGILTGRGPACDALQAWLDRVPLRQPEQIVRIPGNQIAWQRNQVIERAQRLQAPWVLFVDHDCVPPAGALERLLGLGLPLVGATIAERAAPFDLCALRSLEPYARYTVADLKGQTEPFPVVGCGTGCLLIRRAVWDAVPRPWFRCGQISPEVLSEDLDFCLRAGEAGYPPYLDPGTRVGHVVEMLLWPGDDGQLWAQWAGPFGWLPYRQPLGAEVVDELHL